MAVIQSGTTVERIVRAGLVTVLTLGFSLAFLYDAYVGYPRANAAALATSLGLEQSNGTVINRKVTANECKRIARALKDGIADQLVSSLGKASFTHESFDYYVGRGGHLRTKTTGAHVTDAAWREASHTESDLIWQAWIGYTLGAVGVLMLAQLVRVATTRVVLSADGLKVRGRSVIPRSAITRIVSDQFEKTGQVEIEYSMDGYDGRVRLDAYVVKKLPLIVEEIQRQLEDAEESASSTPAPCDLDKVPAE